MKVHFGGLRGSWPVADRTCCRYGGETTSVLIEGAGGERVVLDLGTGARALGQRLVAGSCRDVLVLLTHYHLDHVIGLPSFAPAYDGAFRIEFAAPVRGGRSIRAVLPRLLDDPFWPLQMDALQAKIAFRTLRGADAKRPRLHGGLAIRWMAIPHPAGCTAYRIDEPATGAALVFATDVEWADMTPDRQAAFFAFCRTPATPSLLVFDGHFTPSEYRRYRGWGHSRWTDAVRVGNAVGAKQLILTHHSQFHDDADLAKIDAAVRRALPRARVGREGMAIDL